MFGFGSCRKAVAIAACAATLGLAGCGGGIGSLDPVLTAKNDSGADEDDAAAGRKMIGKPYKVGGKWYTPKLDEDYDKTGLASWYGPGFHGQSTANGETFDQNALTAAHPTLPLPSYVRVTVLKSGKSAVLRVNDRGPFHRGRIIDVSKGAAKKLGMVRAGSAKVRVEYLGEAEVGGTDKHTLVAESKFGPKSRKSFSDYLPSFGFGGSDDDDGGKVEVRLAAAEPATDAGRRGGALPGVNKVRAYEPPPREPDPLSADSRALTATAFADEPKAETGAVDAVIALNSPGLEEVMPPAPDVEPLPEAVVEQSQARVTGAFDMFSTGPGSGSPNPNAGASASDAGGASTGAVADAGTSAAAAGSAQE